MMEYLKVKNWEKFQHYKDRNPPWIKLHVRLLNDREFCLLSRASKCLLVLLWILASENEGYIKNDIMDIRFRLRDDSIQEKEINYLIDRKFLIKEKRLQADDSNCSSETETETETERKQFKPPSLNDVIFYCQEKGFSSDLAKRAFEHYDLANWHDTNGKKVKNWKQKINTVWLKPENKSKPVKGTLEELYK